MCEIFDFSHISFNNPTNLAVEITETKEGEILQFPGKKKGEPLGIEWETRWCDPIRNLDDIKRIIKNLEDRYEMVKDSRKLNVKRKAARDLLMFRLALTEGLRVSDLITLKWSHFFVDDKLTIFSEIKNKKEKKTGKMKQIVVNDVVKRAITTYLTTVPPNEFPTIDDYVFLNARNGKPITEKAVRNFVKEVTYGMYGHYSTHSLRKTYVYQFYQSLLNQGIPHSEALNRVQEMTGHAEQKQLLTYLGLNREQVKSDMEYFGQYLDI